MSIDDVKPEDWDKAYKRQVGGNHYSRYNVQPIDFIIDNNLDWCCLLYTSPSPRDRTRSRMPSSA